MLACARQEAAAQEARHAALQSMIKESTGLMDRVSKLQLSESPEPAPAPLVVNVSPLVQALNQSVHGLSAFAGGFQADVGAELTSELQKELTALKGQQISEADAMSHLSAAIASTCRSSLYAPLDIRYTCTRLPCRTCLVSRTFAQTPFRVY